MCKAKMTINVLHLLPVGILGNCKKRERNKPVFTRLSKFLYLTGFKAIQIFHPKKLR
jgi:hypothetical protein